jgi:glucose-1-phosphate thymidylyltransferase
MKIVIPMAGIGKRLAPLTYHKPKPLVRLADKRLLDFVLNSFQDLEKTWTVEYIFIIGHLGEQIKEYMMETYPHKKVTYYTQKQLMGQSHAVYLAKDSISGPMLLTYCDTINKIDFSFLSSDRLDGVASIQEVEDPSRFGVAVTDRDNIITKLVEKPKTNEHKSALTGVYYFSEGKELIRAIETQIKRGASLNQEYYLADAINILVEAGLQIRAETALEWLDAGTAEGMLETNASILQNRSMPQSETFTRPTNVLIDPGHIHESSLVQNSILGPNVAIGENCIIHGSIIKNTIVDDDSQIFDSILANSLIGKGGSIRRRIMQSIIANGEEIGN